MEVLVIGAAGKSGKVVVEQARAAGHSVTAFVHKTEGYLLDSSVRVVEGDATDRSAMDAAMVGQDAVIDTIGGKNPMKATTLEASAAATITASMQSSGVRRLVVISMIGEGDSIANTNWWKRILLSTLLKTEMKDKAAMKRSWMRVASTGSSFAHHFSAMIHVKETFVSSLLNLEKPLIS